MKKELTIIIVTYNSQAVIAQCLQNLDHKKYDILVIDNASSDNSCDIINRDFPKVKLIKLEKNIGYGRGNNVGLHATKTDFALILNPDAIIKSQDIELVLKAMKKHDDIAIASTGSYSWRRRNSKNFTIKVGKKYAKKRQYGDGYLQNFLGGHAIFMRMKIFKKIGFFDEEIFMFTEDNEICQRAIENGYKNIIVPQAKSFHLSGKSSGKTLSVIYRRFWHLGWSKSRYKTMRKNKINMIRSTSRLIFKHSFESIFYLLQFNVEKSVSKLAFANGCFAYLIGLKAFKKDGNPRGNFLWR